METDFRLADYFIVYISVVLFFAIGAITTLGLGWYATLALPMWIPSPFTAAVVWLVLFLLAAFSAIIVWDFEPRVKGLHDITTLYAGIALLILSWNYLFFGLHLLFLSFLSALLILVLIAVLILVVRRISRKAALLLTPHLVWMLFATYLMHTLFVLNH